MLKLRLSAAFAALMLLSTGCAASPIQNTTTPAVSQSAGESSLSVQTAETAAVPRAVCLDGMLLYDAGRKAVTDESGDIAADTSPEGLLHTEVSEDQLPAEDGQANFPCQDMPYICLNSGAAAVKIDGQYQLFLSEDTVEYAGIYKDKKEVSEDTLQWLNFYYSLSEAERLAISMVPAEFYDDRFGTAAARETSSTEIVAAASYLEALTEEELSETEALAMHYFTEVDSSFEGVDQIYPVDTGEGNYTNHGIENEYSPGNIIIYKVLTTKDRRDGNPFRFISIARSTKSDEWKVINSGY